jgi:parvulin-like peptidyl-prolyl isomerase
VDAKLYNGFTLEQLAEYFAAHPEKFKKEETVTLSDIFLSLEGKKEADVKSKAMQIVAQARAGEDFSKLSNSEMEGSGAGLPQVGTKDGGPFLLSDLRPDFVAAIKDVKAGGVAEPVRTDEGYHILHVDDRTAGKNIPEYNEEQVRQAMTAEHSDKAREKYLQALRDGAYIKVSGRFKDSVAPLLNSK